MYEINEQQIRTWWSLFKNNGELVEIRLLGKAAYSGYFTDIETLITQLRPYLDASNAAKAMHKFFPEPKLLQTYLGKQRAWEMFVNANEDLSDIENQYTPATDGATLVLNNGRGTIVWNRSFMRWEFN